MKTHLLPEYKITGWSPGWYAGFPMFVFYFPMAYLLIALISYIIPFNIAFKLVTVLPAFLMPLCAFFGMKKLEFPFPLPAITALFILPFLFLENFSMYGGNIPSSLAGQFSFAISMALSLFFLCSLYQGIQKSGSIPSNSLLLAIMSLFHLIPVIMAVLSSSYFLLSGRITENLKYLFKVYALSFGLAAFWALPLLANVGYSVSMGFTPSSGIEFIAPPVLYPFFAMALAGIYFAYKNHEKRIFYFAYIALLSVLLYFISPPGYIWNTRFLPFYYIFSMAIAAYGMYCLATRFVRQRFLVAVPVIIAIVTLLYIAFNVTFIHHWISWNYSGFEDKPEWESMQELSALLSSLPDGRVFHEYAERHNYMFGSPRALENIPYFTNKAGMEGLLIESALSSPYHFYLQSELSETPTCPISTIRCTFFNPANAMTHIKLFNIRYIVASSQKLKDALASDERFLLIDDAGPLTVYEVLGESRYVERPKYEPVIYAGSDWKAMSMEWMGRNSEMPVIYTNEDLPFQKINSLDDAREVPAEKCNITEDMREDEIYITTDCIGEPLLVKVSYFPNWHVEGAKKIYLASPSFMMIIPEKQNVKLYYSDTIIDVIGKILSIVAMSYIVFAGRGFSRLKTYQQFIRNKTFRVAK
ncbi:MAG: hypothetical protein HY364_00150 [Candidatus Aenigmarchaeota archaeon]|nr:hypothetical protein [Candidatus Aenigmarchaeota archaeon]